MSADSLDLGRLADNLPSNNGRGARAMQAAEAELQSAFRNSALCITQMLKAGQKSSKRSFQAGYSTALQDVLEYLQSSLDINVDQQRSNEGIAQVIDYIEARQEAVRQELQEIEADEETQQSASSSMRPSGAHPTPSTSAHSFRSHPHYGQQQQHAYRSSNEQSTSSTYQPVASTSGTAGSAASSATHQQQSQHRKQRSTGGRSTSPCTTTRTQTQTSSLQPVSQRLTTLQQASAQQHYSSSPSLLDISERTQESVALASSSSIPNSPEARFTSSTHHADIVAADNHEGMSSSNSATAGMTPPSSSTSVGNVDASLSTASTAVSPLTRLQAKKERERHHDRPSRRQHGHGHGHGHGNDTALQGSTTAGMKRRWTASLLPEQHTINLSMNMTNNPISHFHQSQPGFDFEMPMMSENGGGEGLQQEAEAEEHTNHQAHSSSSPAQRKSSSSTFSQVPRISDDTEAPDMGMEMDESGYRNIDGNARPAKRIARR